MKVYSEARSGPNGQSRPPLWSRSPLLGTQVPPAGSQERSAACSTLTWYGRGGLDRRLALDLRQRSEPDLPLRAKLGQLHSAFAAGIFAK